MRLIKKCVGIFVVFVITIIFIIYQFLGYKYYYEAVLSLKDIPINNRLSSEKLFYGNLNDDKFYSGTLAFIINSKSKTPTIWIWGKKGLRYFITDSKTIFSNYKICQGEEWKTGKGSVYRNSNIDVKAWLSEVKQGDLVGIDSSGFFSYDWWIFKIYSKDELIITCQNR